MHQRAFSDRTSFYRTLLQKRNHDSSIPLDLFCRKHGISPWTYYYWKKRLGLQDTGQRKLLPDRKAFLPVAIPAQHHSDTVFSEVILPGGVTIRFPGGFDKEMFRAVIEVFSSSRT